MQGGKARIEGPALPLFLGKLRRYEYVYVIYRGRYNPKCCLASERRLHCITTRWIMTLGSLYTE